MKKYNKKRKIITECLYCKKNESERERFERELIRIYNSKKWKLYLFYRKIYDVIKLFYQQLPKRIYEPIFIRLKTIYYKIQNRVFYKQYFTYSTKNPVNYLINSPSYKPKVSVIVPFYNQSFYITQTLNSLKNQWFQDFEVIIIDDESSGYHLNRIRSIAKKYNYLLIENKKNKGPGFCRNLGIEKARGTYILCLDSDDILPVYSLMDMVVSLEQNQTYGFVYGNYQYFGERDYLEKRKEYNFYTLLKENYIIITSLFRRLIWEECGHFDETLFGYEDWDFWINAGKNGWYGYYLDKTILNVRIKPKSRNLLAIKKNKKLIRYIKNKHKELYKKRNIHMIKKLWKSKIRYQ